MRAAPPLLPSRHAGKWVKHKRPGLVAEWSWWERDNGDGSVESVFDPDFDPTKEDQPTSVVLSGRAQATLRTLRLDDGLENGGGMHGHTTREGVLVIDDLFLATLRRGRFNVAIDLEKVEHRGAAAGVWHSHTQERGIPTPSRADLRAALRRLKPGGRLVELIITRHDDWTGNLRDWLSWERPHVTAFVYDRTPDGEPDVEIAAVRWQASHELGEPQPRPVETPLWHRTAEPPAWVL